MQQEVFRSYPIQWPPGWRRSRNGDRKDARFHIRETVQAGDGQHSWKRKKELSVYESIQRIEEELSAMGLRTDDVVISTNVPTRLNGLPRSGAREPDDPGAAVYWRTRQRETRCMAIDFYRRVADNLAAIAATLSAMRAIQRHGGAAILDRAFTGFKALPAPEQWWQVLGLDDDHATEEQIQEVYLQMAQKHHPDHGGEEWIMARINAARDRGLEAVKERV